MLSYHVIDRFLIDTNNTRDIFKKRSFIEQDKRTNRRFNFPHNDIFFVTINNTYSVRPLNLSKSGVSIQLLGKYELKVDKLISVHFASEKQNINFKVTARVKWQIVDSIGAEFISVDTLEDKMINTIIDCFE